MKRFFGLCTLSLVLLIVSIQVIAKVADTSAVAIQPASFASESDDKFSKSFYSDAAPTFGLLQKRADKVLIIDVFNRDEQYLNSHRELSVTFDGLTRAKVSLPDKSETSFGARQYNELSNINLPSSHLLNDELAGDVFLLSDETKFSDPAKWTVAKNLSASVKEAGQRTLVTSVELLVCKKSQIKKTETLMIHIANASAFEHVKSYKNFKGEVLSGFSLNKEKVKFPVGVSWCNSATDLEDEDNRKSLKIQDRAIFWGFQSKKTAAVYLGRGVPIDAGDYNGDGESEFIFYEPSCEIGFQIGTLKVFSSDFRKVLKIPVGRK